MTGSRIVSALAVTLVLLHGAAASARDMGALEIRGTATVQSPGRAALSFNDTRYVLSAGDRVATRPDSVAVLRLPNEIGRVALLADSEAVLTLVDRRLSVELLRGALVYVMCLGSELEVRAQPILASTGLSDPQREEARMRPVAGAGVIALSGDGSAGVAVREGELLITEGEAVIQRVAAGEEFTYFGTGSGFADSLLTVLEQSEEDSDGVCAPILPGRRTAMLPTQWVVGGVVLGAGIYFATRREGSREPASP